MTEKHTVTLERGPNGLGFNISGGIDEPVEGERSIIISTISESGSAAADGHLKVGDLIVEVNGKSLESLRHDEAVEIFHNAGDIVSLTVLRRVEKPDYNWLCAAVAVMGTIALIVAILWHKKKKQF